MLLHKWYEDGEWRPSQDGFDVVWKGSLGGPPKAVEKDGMLHVFMYDEGYALVHVWSKNNDGTRWTSETKVGNEKLNQLPQ